MLIEGKFVAHAPVQKLWEFLLTDPTRLVSCIPGCENIETVDERKYLTTIKSKVGPITARFEGPATLTDLEPPSRFKIKGEGTAKGVIGKVGSFHYDGVVELKEISGKESEVSYRLSMSVVGKLATFGEKIMRAKLSEMGEDFTRCLKDMLEKEIE